MEIYISHLKTTSIYTEKLHNDIPSWPEGNYASINTETFIMAFWLSDQSYYYIIHYGSAIIVFSLQLETMQL